MFDFLRSWIVNIITLVILIVLLEMMLPSGKIKKMANLVSGFILIIAIINPLLGLLKNGIDLKDFQIKNSNMINRKEIEVNSKILEEKQMKQIADVYRMKLVKQLEESVGEIKEITCLEADVTINEDYNSSAFGEIKRIYLNLSVNSGNQGIKPVDEIKKVDMKSEDNSEDNVPSRYSEEIARLVRNKVQKLFEVDEGKIVLNFI